MVEARIYRILDFLGLFGERSRRESVQVCRLKDYVVLDYGRGLVRE
jgi:hypothetical protein